jgi:hypothetical protein
MGWALFKNFHRLGDFFKKTMKKGEEK